MRKLLLYALTNDVLSKKAINALRSAECLIDRDVQIDIRYTSIEQSKQPILPALLFKVLGKTAYKLQGSFSSEDIIKTMRRLG